MCKNRPSRGGGVCIAFDTNRVNFKRFTLPASNFEVVCAVGTVKGFTKRVAAMAIYIPPKYNAAQMQELCEYVSDAIERVKRTCDDPYICLGGDLNNRDLSPALVDYPDLELLPGIPTRWGAALDLCYTNFNSEVHKVGSYHPLTNLAGVPSDHLVVRYDFQILRRHHCSVITRKVRKISEEGIDNFKLQLLNIDWACLDGWSSSQMVDIMDSILEELQDVCFPENTVKTRSTDDPWITKRIKRIIRRKKRQYKRGGKDKKWKDIDAALQVEIGDNRRRHIEKVKKRVLEDRNPRAYHAAINIMKNKNPIPKWTPSELFPGETDLQVAERCAVFFNSISSEFEQIEPPRPPENKLQPPLVYEVSGRLKSIRKPRSQVPGDLDPRVVNHVADILAIPLQKIYAEVFRTCCWPERWKRETVTIIPKTTSPLTLGETRNLSCTPLFSKLLESFLLEKLRRDIKLNSTQFGGIKGLGVDHFLVETWDEILRAVDGGGKAVNLMSVDFQKAFNRMDHRVCLERLRHKGAGEHLVQLVAAFLFNRTMVVKIGDQRSGPKTVNGGAPQGSLLGPLLFCVVSEILAERVGEIDYDNAPQAPEPLEDSRTSVYDDPEQSTISAELSTSAEEWANVDREFNFFARRRRNPLNDTAPSTPPQTDPGDEDEERVPGPRPTVKAYIDDFNIVDMVDTATASIHFSTQRAQRRIYAGKSDRIFEVIKCEAEEINMKVNAQKTKMLCIDQNPNYNTTTYIQPDGTRIKSEDSLKILGFYFHTKPDCKLHIEKLLLKFRNNLWYLRRLGLRVTTC